LRCFVCRESLISDLRVRTRSTMLLAGIRGRHKYFL